MASSSSQLVEMDLNASLIAAAGAARGATIMFKLWLLTAGENGRAKYRAAIDDHWEHLRFIERGLLATCVNETHGLLAGHKDALRLPRLASRVRGHGLDTTEVDQRLGELEPIAVKLAVLRHEAFGHRTRKHSYDETFKRAGISSNEIGIACSGALICANRLLRARGLPETQYSALPLSSYEEMLAQLW